MVAASKLFEWPIKKIHCSQLPLHRGRTCFQSFLYDFYRFTISGLGYYSPLVLTPLLSKRTKINIKNLIETLRFYGETVLTSSTVGTSIFASICILRYLTGELKLWTTFLLGPYLISQTCWFFPKRSMRIFLMATTQCTLEALIRQRKSAFTYSLLNSKAFQTLLFMTSSTIIMHYKRLGLYNGFWFIKPQQHQVVPAKERSDKEEGNGNAKLITRKVESNWNCLLEDCKTYLIYGLSLDILNTIIKRHQSFKNKQLLKVIGEALKGLRLNMTCFFMSYAAIYKFILLLLPKYMNDSFLMDYQHGVAAFLGGASYIFLNKLTCNTFAIILAVQISWNDFCRKVDKIENRKNEFLNILKEIPFSQIIFPLNIVFIVYTFFYNNNSLNSLGKNLARAVTDQKIQRILDYINKNDLDYIVKDCSIRPIFGAF